LSFRNLAFWISACTIFWLFPAQKLVCLRLVPYTHHAHGEVMIVELQFCYDLLLGKMNEYPSFKRYAVPSILMPSIPVPTPSLVPYSISVSLSSLYPMPVPMPSGGLPAPIRHILCNFKIRLQSPFPSFPLSTLLPTRLFIPTGASGLAVPANVESLHPLLFLDGSSAMGVASPPSSSPSPPISNASVNSIRSPIPLPAPIPATPTFIPEPLFVAVLRDFAEASESVEYVRRTHFSTPDRLTAKLAPPFPP